MSGKTPTLMPTQIQFFSYHCKGALLNMVRKHQSHMLTADKKKRPAFAHTAG